MLIYHFHLLNFKAQHKSRSGTYFLRDWLSGENVNLGWIGLLLVHGKRCKFWQNNSTNNAAIVQFTYRKFSCLINKIGVYRKKVFTTFIIPWRYSSWGLYASNAAADFNSACRFSRNVVEGAKKYPLLDFFSYSQSYHNSGMLDVLMITFFKLLSNLLHTLTIQLQAPSTAPGHLTFLENIFFQG